MTGSGGKVGFETESRRRGDQNASLRALCGSGKAKLSRPGARRYDWNGGGGVEAQKKLMVDAVFIMISRGLGGGSLLLWRRRTAGGTGLGAGRELPPPRLPRKNGGGWCVGASTASDAVSTSDQPFPFRTTPLARRPLVRASYWPSSPIPLTASSASASRHRSSAPSVPSPPSVPSLPQGSDDAGTPAPADVCSAPSISEPGQ